jgi:hypothetical protein
MGERFFHQFDPSNQMMGYAWCAQQFLGKPIAGVRINAHAVLKTTSKFARQIITYSQDRLQEWGANYNEWVVRINESTGWWKRYLNDEIEPGPGAEEVLLHVFPHNWEACAGKYGQCVYTDVCSSPVRVRQTILEKDFELHPWNPLEIRDAQPE